MMAIMAPGGHPRLYETQADVARAKVNVQRFAWAKAYMDEVRKGADKWAAMSDDQLRALVPPIGSVFAYGFSGCPICGASWSSWGAGGIGSLDKPGMATCPKCHHSFPDADHPDSGQGWHEEKSGKTYYFVGCYNAYIAQQITLVALRQLSTAYAVTGDRKYSHAAAVLFDKLADLYPTSVVGSIDYPEGANNNGRLERPQYQVARVLVYLADYLDLLYNSPDFAARSASGKGSVREHIENDVIADGGKYCYDKAMGGHYGLTNGEADYVRGALAAGIMLDKTEWIDCATKSPYRMESFLDNCLDRDGQYYESSVGYSEHCLSLYLDAAEMLYNVRTPEYPNGINLYNHPKLRKALFDAQIDINVFGHMPRFGDWGADTGVVTTDSQFLPNPYAFSEYLTARATDPATRDYWAAARDFICEGNVEEHRAGDPVDYLKPWLLWHAEPVTKPKTQAKFEPRAVLGGRGIATLRSGSGADGRGALLRYGPSLNHGHYDDLNLNLYALGRELTYDLGYALGSAHAQVGWAKVTASHNLVVVNEQNQLESPGGGGSLDFYVERGCIRAAEASSEASYASEGVKTYRRTTALVEAGAGSYYVDFFRVAGGSQHDLMWHFFGKLNGVAGAELGEVQEQGSLAGADIDWGRKVGPSGYLIGCADKGDYWNPPPGNGYGFLYSIRRSKSVGPQCTATWQLDPEKPGSVNLTLLPEPGAELITAHAPGINPNAAQADYAILRRKGSSLNSTFISIVEPVEQSACVKSVTRLQSKTEGAVGVEVKTSSGTDYILSSNSPKPAVFQTTEGAQITFNGQFGFIRVVDGKVRQANLVGGTLLQMGSLKLIAPKRNTTGTVKAVDLEKAKLTLSAKVHTPKEGIIYLSREGYSHSSPYRVRSIDGNSVTLDGDLVLARGQIGDAKPTAPDALMNVVPLPRATIVGLRPSGYFRGKLIRNDRTGAASTIVDVDGDQRTVHVNEPTKFRAGDSFTIFDLQAGDGFRLPCVVGE